MRNMSLSIPGLTVASLYSEKVSLEGICMSSLRACLTVTHLFDHDGARHDDAVLSTVE